MVDSVTHEQLDSIGRDLLDRCSFPPAGSVVTCAVSGGADSSALLVLAVAAGCEVTAVHVDHGLRAGGAVEAAAVRDLAERVGADFRAEQVCVTPGGNLQERARTERFAALPDDVLTGHTADDQAETILLSIGRGAGLSGVAGMSRMGHPILGLRRSDTEAVCAALGIEPLADPTNLDARHRRVRVRREVLPLLDAVFERDVAPVIARQGEYFSEIEDLLDQLASTLDATDCVALTEAHVAVARWAIRSWLTTATGGRPPDGASIQRVLDVAHGRIRSTEVVGGGRVLRTDRKLRLAGLPTDPGPA